MTRLLLCISFLLCLCRLSVTAQTHPLLLDGEERAAWNVTLQRGQTSITGICIARKDGQGVVGSVVNEFGIHLFDFTCHNNRVKVCNLFAAMDKWYIRRILRRDLRLLVADKPLNTKPNRLLQAWPPDSLLLQNNKYHIAYHFQRLRE